MNKSLYLQVTQQALGPFFFNTQQGSTLFCLSLIYALVIYLKNYYIYKPLLGITSCTNILSLRVRLVGVKSGGRKIKKRKQEKFWMRVVFSQSDFEGEKMVGPSSFLSGPPKLNLPNLGKKNTRENNVRCFGQNNPQNKVHYSSTASFLFCHFVQLFLTFFFYVVPCRFFPPWCSSVSLLVSFVLF